MTEETEDEENGMKNRLLLAAAMAAAFAPTAGNSVELLRHGDTGPSLGNWFGKGRPKRLTKRQRSVNALQRHAWNETPCDAPEGYFWHRTQREGFLPRYWLKKCAPGERRVVYDEQHDRSIIYSGWGYVKPTYAPGDVR